MARPPRQESEGFEVKALHSGPHERLLGLRSAVSPDGDSVSFACHYTHQKPFLVHVTIEEMGPILNEIRTASNIMVTRQRLKVDRGAQKMLELCESALRPVAHDVVIDPLTGDRLFIFQFSDHSPLVIRMTAVETDIGLFKLHEAVRRSQN